MAAQPQIFLETSAPASPPSLRLLLQQATLEHPQVRSQVQTLQAAGLDILVAQQAYWPTPSVTLERAQTQAPDPAYAGSPQVLTFRLQQALWTGGRLTAQADKAAATQAIERARFNEVQQAVALKTLQAWIELVSAQRQQGALHTSEDIQAQLLQKIERRFDQGLAARSDASYAGMRLMQVRQEHFNAKQQEQIAWIRLKQWVPQAQAQARAQGQATFQAQTATPAQVAELATWPEQPPLQDSALWLQQGLANSALVQRLHHGAQLQMAELAEKRAALQPEVYVRAEHQRGNYTYAHLPNVNRVFVGLTASTGAGLGLWHQLAALQSKHEGALEEIAAAQSGVMESLQLDVVNANARQSKVAALRLHLESSQAMQSAWERQFINGKKTWSDVMNAAKETSQAELALIENDMALLHSRWRLHIQAHGVAAWTVP